MAARGRDRALRGRAGAGSSSRASQPATVRRRPRRARSPTGAGSQIATSGTRARRRWRGPSARRSEHDADHPAAHGARQRDGVGDLAHEVAHDDDRDGGGRAERVEHGPEHRRVKAPPDERAEQAVVPAADEDERVADRGAEGCGGVADRSPRPVCARRAGRRAAGAAPSDRAARRRPITIARPQPAAGTALSASAGPSDVKPRRALRRPGRSPRGRRNRAVRGR
jgi:hypothetical protein